MRILIFGAGAIGSVLATMLSPLHDVDVAVRGEHARRILEEGLIIRGAVERSAHPGTEPRGRYDMIFITTKAYDVEQASRSAEAFSGDETTIVSPQNGLRHVGVLTERFGDRVVLSPTTMGATRIGQVEVRLAAMGTTVVGSMHGDPGRAEKVAAVLNEAGVRSEVSDNIIGEVWTKAIVNACINPLASLAGVPYGVLLERRPLLAIAELACSEAVAAATACGVVLTRHDVFSWVKDVMRSTRENRCSMLQDIEAGRRTEIDEINGELVRIGEANDVRMDVNRSLWTLLRAAEGRQMPSERIEST